MNLTDAAARLMTQDLKPYENYYFDHCRREFSFHVMDDLLVLPA